MNTARCSTLDLHTRPARWIAMLLLLFLVIDGSGLGAQAQTIDLSGLETATVVATASPTATPMTTAALGPARSGQQPAATVELESRRSSLASRTRPGDGERDESWRVRYVRWAGAGAQGQSAVGLSVGFGLQRTTTAALAAPGAVAPGVRLAPEFGVRWRSSWRQDRRVDVDAWRSYEAEERVNGFGLGDRQAANNARVELQFRDPGDNGRLNIPRGAFGIQTSANSQWVLRAKRGGPMVYYRARW